MKKQMKKVEIELAEQIIEAIEAGAVLPWQMPWKKSGLAGGIPSNFQSKKAYSGINILCLWLAENRNAFTCNQWLTYRQAATMGGQVRKGETGTKIVKFGTFKTENKKTGDEETRGYLKSFTVFNLDQIDGIEPEKIEPLTLEWTPVDAAEKIAIDSGAEINHGGDAAFFMPSQDRIQMPNREQFQTAENYYSTLLHELTHWTGHKSRLDRMPGINKKYEGKAAYAFEELVAEMGACFLMAEIGLLGGEIENHKSYLASWAQLLKDKPAALMSAASLASKAAAHLSTTQAAAVSAAA